MNLVIYNGQLRRIYIKLEGKFARGDPDDLDIIYGRFLRSEYKDPMYSHPSDIHIDGPRCQDLDLQILKRALKYLKNFQTLNKLDLIYIRRHQDFPRNIEARLYFRAVTQHPWFEQQPP